VLVIRHSLGRHPIQTGRDLYGATDPVELKSSRPLSDAARRVLEACLRREAPAITYAFLHRDGQVSLFAGGRADAASGTSIDLNEPLPLYSMTKAITAVATLELLARRGIGLDAMVGDLASSFPFDAHRVRVGDLLAHTSGLPNPFPLRWVHRLEEHAGFDDRAARERTCGKLRAGPPNVRYRYSNVGYWWLDPVIESLSGKPYLAALADLGLPSTTFYPPTARACGHIRRFGILRAVGSVALDRWVLTGHAGTWTCVARHHVDGVAYGGLLGTVAELVPFLGRLLRIADGRAGEMLRQAVVEPRQLENGRVIPMTSALHVGDGFLFKEGGGAGFHSELRAYLNRGCASVLIANASEIDVKRLLSHVDALMME
jgi:D-alanyl-D-alanine carboxypeptidase